MPVALRILACAGLALVLSPTASSAPLVAIRVGHLLEPSTQTVRDDVVLVVLVVLVVEDGRVRETACFGDGAGRVPSSCVSSTNGPAGRGGSCGVS